MGRGINTVHLTLCIYIWRILPGGLRVCVVAWCVQMLDQLLQAKIERPQLDLGKEGAAIIRAAVQLITSE